MAEIAALAENHDLWCDVDACVGGFMLPFARMLGHDIHDFDFALPGVSSISADLHKYGYAYRGCSVLCLRDKGLDQWQGFATEAWNGGAYFSKTTTGSRNAGPVASAWAVMRYLGVDGYMRITGQIIAMREAFPEGIRRVEGLEVVGTPQDPDFAFWGTAVGYPVHGRRAGGSRMGYQSGRPARLHHPAATPATRVTAAAVFTNPFVG